MLEHKSDEKAGRRPGIILTSGPRSQDAPTNCAKPTGVKMESGLEEEPLELNFIVWGKTAATVVVLYSTDILSA